MKIDLKNLILLIMTASLALPAAADKAPPASDYDKEPAQVFTPNRSVPVQNSNYQLDKSSALSASVQEDNGDVVTLNYDPALYFDWQILVDLNNSAAEAWQTLVRCNGGDENNARVQYQSGSLCREAATKMRLLFESVNMFIMSTDLEAFRMENVLKCTDASKCSEQFRVQENSARHRQYSKNNYADKLVDIAFRYKPNQKVDPVVEKAKNLLSQFPNQNFHPLLIQVLFEHVAAGYPAHYGYSVCTSLNQYVCVLTPVSKWQRIVLSSSDRRMPRARVSDPLKVAEFEAEWSTSHYIDESLPPVSGSDQHSWTGTQRIVRNAALVMRLLNHMSVGQLSCSSWGLWPKATVELLGIYALARLRRGDHILTHIYEENKDSQLLALRLSDACNEGLGDNLLVPESTDSAGGPEAASTIGAWRKLYNRHREP